ncbi:MAG: TIGR03936 family radical SAM-associated protein [Lachnospiraceae bacterium]|nr:TIGR03936 family radical SAM-associated protein [Lachnospiraceae bacterium]
MKTRIKYAKTGPLQYIGHLDMLRSFQKIMRRAEVDIAYSNGFSPHQISSFAAPLGIGITSEGEYMDAEFNSISSPRDMIDRINAATNTPYLKVLGFRELKEGEKKAMAAVAAARYQISLRDDKYNDIFLKMKDGLDAFLNQDEIRIVKKTKKSEIELDIRPLIYECEFSYKTEHYEAFEIADHILDGKKLPDKDSVPTFSMFLSSGSENNLKPEAFLAELASFTSIEIDPIMLAIHRIDMYKKDENGGLTSL